MSVVGGNGWKFGQGFSNRDLAMVLRLMRNSSRDFGDLADFRRLSREFETTPAIAEDPRSPSKDSKCDCQFYQSRKAEPVA
jgi:hypothetical protein